MSRLEGSWKHDDRDIDWTEFDDLTIRCVLSFIYSGDYKLEPRKSSVSVETQSVGTQEVFTLQEDEDPNERRCMILR
jgi:hypothetical protein